jgi:hypothetical protein
VIQDVIAPEMRATAIGLSLLLAHLLGDATAPSAIGALAGKVSLGLALTLTAPLSLFIAGLICLLGLRTVARDMKRMRESMQSLPALYPDRSPVPFDKLRRNIES